MIKKLFSIFAAVLFAGSMMATDYQLVTSTDDLEAGANYVIGSAASGSGIFMATTSNTNNRRGTSSITITNNKITATNEVLVLQLGGSTGAWTFLTTNYLGTDGYLAAASNNSNYCQVITDNTAARAQFTVSFSGNAVVITAKGGGNRRNMRYNPNNGSPLFACYQNATDQSPIYLYKEVPTTPILEVDKGTLNFDDAKQYTGNHSMSFTVTGANLTSNVNLAINPAGTWPTITLSHTELTPDENGEINQEVTVTISSETAYNYTNSIAITSANSEFDLVRVYFNHKVTPRFKVQVGTNSSAMGSATVNGEAYAYVDEDETFNLAAEANAGYEFDKWTLSTGSLSVTDVNAAETTGSTTNDGTITANFKVSVTPAISLDKSEIEFEDVIGEEASSTTFTITAANIEAETLTIVADNDIKDHITLSDASVVVTAGSANAEITVTGNTEAVGEWIGYITVDDGENGAPAQTIEVYVTVKNKYTITWHVCGAVDQTTKVVAGNKIAPIADPVLGVNYVAKTFVGWATDAITTPAASASLVDFTKIAAPTADAEFYAVFADVVPAVEGSCNKTAIGDLKTDDAVVITSDNGSVYAMSNSVFIDSKGPKAVSVTVSDNAITSEVTNDILWDITKDEDGFSFAVHGGTDNLYCTSDNNGVRVGSSTSYNIFDIDENYLHNTGRNRYLGVYISQDWRCYTSVNTNISGQTLAFYKYVAAVPESKSNYVTTVPEKPVAPISWSVATGKAYLPAGVKESVLPEFSNANSLAVAFSSSDEDVATVNSEGAITQKAAGSTTISATYTATADGAYKTTVVSYTLTVHAATSLAIDYSAATTGYEKGAFFSLDGIKAIATFGDETTADVTTAATWTPAELPQINADANIEVTATWNELQKTEKIAVTVNLHKVTFAAPANGNLTIKNGDDAIASGAEFVKGTTLTVEATPAVGYKLVTLTANGEDISEGKEFTIGTTDVEVVAVFDVASALDNTSVEGKAVKVLRDGQLVIEKNGVRYNAMGQVIR